SQRGDPCPRACVLLRPRARLLGRPARGAAGAGAYRRPPASGLVHGGDDPELDPRDCPRVRRHARLRRLSSLTDQQLAAGVMWVPGSLTYFVAAIYFFYRWLEPGTIEAPPATEPRPEELSWT